MGNEALRISSLEFSQDPYRFYRKLRSGGKFHPIIDPEGVLVVGFDECKRILNDPEAFSSSVNAFVDPVLLGSDPPEHTGNKGVLQFGSGLFSQSRIAGLRSMVQKICDDLIRGVMPQQRFDLVSQFAFPLSSLVTMNILGIEVPKNIELGEWTRSAVSNRSIHNKDFAISQWELLKPQIEGWIQETKDRKGNTGLGEILSHETTVNDLSHDQVMSLVKILLIGGNETTPNLISSAMLHLLSDTSLLEEVKSDHSLIPALIRETLRFDAPTQMVNRVCVTDFQFQDYDMRKGTFVALGIAAANRDPEFFDAPEEFNIHRKEKLHLSFGFGPHYCIGSHLANLEAAVAIEMLLNSFDELHLPKDYSPVYRNSSHVHGLTDLPIITKMDEQCSPTMRLRTDAIDLIRSEASKFGEIPTYQNFPNFEEKKHKGWHYTYASPFVHANVLYSLINSGDQEAIKLARDNVSYLLESKEPGDVWRFWKVDDCENPVPPDIDDISICSFVLKRLGFEVKNRKLLLDNIKEDGRFLTWVFPNIKMAITNPRLFLEFYKTKEKVLPTLLSGMLHPNDNEIGVTANALMYLGECKQTTKAIQKCVDDWNNSSDSFNFYGSKLVVGFHLARAYKEGVGQFIELKESILEMIIDELEHYQFPELLIAFLTLNYFDHRDAVTSYIERRIKNHCLRVDHAFGNYPYFTSKDRVFFAGSTSLTAAWFLEASHYFERS